jgi:hypothetical protein
MAQTLFGRRRRIKSTERCAIRSVREVTALETSESDKVRQTNLQMPGPLTICFYI